MENSFEWQQRMDGLREQVKRSGLDAFIVTGQESIYYLTGASYKPLERPFFILVWPHKARRWKRTGSIRAGRAKGTWTS
jgi:Xaa-Pro dipeptidase